MLNAVGHYVLQPFRHSSTEINPPESIGRLKRCQFFARILGTEFVREDAADATLNLLKFDAGRSNYALTGEVFLRYQQGRNGQARNVQNPLVVKRYLASCAVSRATPYPLAEINRAIRTVRERKELDAIYDKYR